MIKINGNTHLGAVNGKKKETWEGLLMQDEKLNTEDDATDKPTEKGSVGFPDGEDKSEKEE